MKMTEKRFKSFIYGWLMIILMFSFVGLAGGSFMNLQTSDNVKMKSKSAQYEKPLQFKKMVKIEKIETKYLLMLY
jgi:hypothetical protein